MICAFSRIKIEVKLIGWKPNCSSKICSTL